MDGEQYVGEIYDGISDALSNARQVKTKKEKRALFNSAKLEFLRFDYVLKTFPGYTVLCEALLKAELELDIDCREVHGFILLGEKTYWYQWACTCGEWCAVAYPAGHGNEKDNDTLRKVHDDWQKHLSKPRSEWFTDWRNEDFASNIYEAMAGKVKP